MDPIAEHARIIRQSINVPFSYPVYFTRDVFGASAVLVEDVLNRSRVPGSKVIMFIDAGLAESRTGLADRAASWLAAQAAAEPVGEPVLVPGGERVKNGWGPVRRIIGRIMDGRLCRHSYVIAAGGGAFLDAVGFAAGIVHRGIRLIRMPSTTLSQDDSGMGVKNGINIGNIKNAVGSFNPPHAVISDLDFLSSLPRGLMLDGIAEAFKVAVIKDESFFSFLEENSGGIRTGDPAVIEETVRWCAAIHLRHISSSDDPFEFGTSRPLDFGHWSAHMIEGMSRYAVRHGQAVAAGICLDTHYAQRTGLIDRETGDRILRAMRAAGMELFHEIMLRRGADGRLELLRGLDLFREYLGGRLSITLPTGIGSCIEAEDMDERVIGEALADAADGESSP